MVNFHEISKQLYTRMLAIPNLTVARGCADTTVASQDSVTPVHISQRSAKAGAGDWMPEVFDLPSALAASE